MKTSSSWNRWVAVMNWPVESMEILWIKERGYCTGTSERESLMEKIGALEVEIRGARGVLRGGKRSPTCALREVIISKKKIENIVRQ